MTTQVDNIHIQGNEHWTKKGDAKLFLWEKRRAQNSPDSGTILFVHGSSMASQPTFDLQVPGPSGRDGLFRRPGLRHLDASTWRATAAPPRTAASTPRSRRAPTTSRPRPTTSSRPATTPARCWCMASRRGRCARRCSRSAIRTASGGWRSTPMSGPAKAARRWSSAARSCRNTSRPSGGRSTASSCARSSSATIPAPPTTT